MGDHRLTSTDRGTTSESLNRVIVVGASLAGLRATETLRKAGFEGQIVLIGEEPRLPYDRPPLSKEVLTGDRAPDTITFRDQEYFDDLDVDLRLGRRATGLDLKGRELALGPERLAFDGLILATGAAPRMLPGAEEFEGVHMLRTVDDALVIKTAMEKAPRVAVVGAGFIGSEIASSAKSRGLEVTVVEAFSVPLVRGVGHQMGAVCASLHQDHGTDLRTGVSVEALDGAGRVERVRLSDGSTIEADLVVIGIGVEPATGWLEDSGVTIRSGLVCDATLCAGPARVYAAGDLVRWPNPFFGNVEMRVEHWTNAAEQGIQAARNLLAGGAAQPFRSVPYFWSDQYGVRIQLVGYLAGDQNEVRVCYGSVEERRFVALYRRGQRLVAALGMNSPRLVMQYRTKIGENMSWDDALAFGAAQS